MSVDAGPGGSSTVSELSVATMSVLSGSPTPVLVPDGAPSDCPLTVRLDFPDGMPFRLALPNQCGNPCRRLNPPGGSRSSSVALTGSSLAEPVLKVYVVRGTIKGWKTSVVNVTKGGRSG